MESLGFIDKPAQASTWATSSTMVKESPREPAPPEQSDRFFEDWSSAEVGKKLHTRNIRWGVILITILTISLLGFAGYWIYQQPARNAAAAAENLSVSANALRPDVAALLSLDLTTDFEAVVALLPATEQNARDLFNTSGTLPSSMGSDRLLAADAAGEVLEAARSLNDAYSYRAAVIPILALPNLETDPALIELEEAAQTFSTWQAKFVNTSDSLPTGTMGAVGESLLEFAPTLADTQRTYLDALRENDPATAALVVSGLTETLGSFEALLESTMTQVAAEAREQLEAADFGLSQLLR